MGQPTSSGAFAKRPQAPWAAPRGLDSVLRRWRSDRGLRRNVLLDEVLPAQEGRYAPIPETLAPTERGGATFVFPDNTFRCRSRAGGVFFIDSAGDCQ